MQKQTWWEVKVLSLLEPDIWRCWICRSRLGHLAEVNALPSTIRCSARAFMSSNSMTIVFWIVVLWNRGVLIDFSCGFYGSCYELKRSLVVYAMLVRTSGSHCRVCFVGITFCFHISSMHLLFLLRIFVKKKLNSGVRGGTIGTVSTGMQKTAKLSWNFYTLKRESYINTIIFGAILLLLLPLASLTIVVGQAIEMLLSDR